MITSDADLWPLNAWWYWLPSKKKIHLTNPFCCGIISHHGMTFRHIPMSCIGMQVKTWKEVLSPPKWPEGPPLNASQIVQLLVREFGQKAAGYIRKGVGVGWYFDQHMISYLLALWMEKHGNSSVHFSHTHLRRHNRGRWHPDTIDNYTDAHLPKHPYQDYIWRGSMMPMVKLMYGNDEDLLRCINEYAIKFRVLYEMTQPFHLESIAHSTQM